VLRSTNASTNTAAHDDHDDEEDGGYERDEKEVSVDGLRLFGFGRGCVGAGAGAGGYGSGGPGLDNEVRDEYNNGWPWRAEVVYTPHSVSLLPFFFVFFFPFYLIFILRSVVPLCFIYF
jgi:hypothetical protein